MFRKKAKNETHRSSSSKFLYHSWSVIIIIDPSVFSWSSLSCCHSKPATIVDHSEEKLSSTARTEQRYSPTTLALQAMFVIRKVTFNYIQIIAFRLSGIGKEFRPSYILFTENPCPGFFFDHCQTVKSLTLPSRQCNFYGSTLTGPFLLPNDTAHQIFVNRKLPLVLYRKTRWYFLIYNSQVIHNIESGLLMEEENLKVPACSWNHRLHIGYLPSHSTIGAQANAFLLLRATRWQALKEYWIRPRVPTRYEGTPDVDSESFTSNNAGSKLPNEITYVYQAYMLHEIHLRQGKCVALSGRLLV